MDHIAVYVEKKTGQKVFVVKHEILEIGQRVHYKLHLQQPKLSVTGLSDFKKRYFYVSGAKL